MTATILPQLSDGQPEQIVSLVDVHFVSPNLDMSPPADPAVGDSVRFTANLGLDGRQNWTKRGVVLDRGAPGSDDSWELNSPSVMYEGSTYRMWYAGTKGTFPFGTIMYAESPDGISWTRYGTVLNYGPAGEEGNVHFPSVMRDGMIYKMWYSAYDFTNYRLFWATSPDGIAWTRQGLALPLGPAGSYDDYLMFEPFVLLEGGVYKMWYTGNDGSYNRILYATSPDGVSWTKQGLALDRGPGATEAAGVSMGWVAREATGYHMWYTGGDGTSNRIHYATSADGMLWTKRGLVLDLGAPGGTEARHVSSPSILHLTATSYQMWYTGRSSGTVYDRIHYANLTGIPLPADVAVDFYLDGISPASRIEAALAQVGMLSPGSAWVDWTAGPAGWHTIYAVIDQTNSIPEWDEGNNTATLDVYVRPMPDYVPSGPDPTPPVTVGLRLPIRFSIHASNQGHVIGNSSAVLAFYNETTPLVTFATFVMSPIDPGGTSSMFSADWISPAASGTFRIIVDVDYANDIVEENETNNLQTWTVNVVDGPTTTLTVGLPKYESAKTYVKSSTPLDFYRTDRSGIGIRDTSYRIDGGPWKNYSATGQFTLAGDGEHVVEWFSTDNAGNMESVSSKSIQVDDTPPETAISPSVGPFRPQTVFNLTAADDGSGVSVTYYRIDGNNPILFSGPFHMPLGNHTVEFWSVDSLTNIETPKSLLVETHTDTISVQVETNFKPLIATVFAFILAFVGLATSWRRPWKHKAGKKAVLTAFAAMSLPFVIAAALTGLISLSTGALSIPPVFGIGTAVDSAIILAGIFVALVWALKAGPKGPRSPTESRRA